MEKLEKVGLKNFRIFKDYTEFEIKPLTILTGPNNSGKSSLFKAILLLKKALNRDLFSPLELNHPIVDLGCFDDVHNNSCMDDNIHIKINNYLFYYKPIPNFDSKLFLEKLEIIDERGEVHTKFSWLTDSYHNPFYEVEQEFIVLKNYFNRNKDKYQRLNQLYSVLNNKNLIDQLKFINPLTLNYKRIWPATNNDRNFSWDTVLLNTLNDFINHTGDHIYEYVNDFKRREFEEFLKINLSEINQPNIVIDDTLFNYLSELYLQSLGLIVSCLHYFLEFSNSLIYLSAFRGKPKRTFNKDKSSFIIDQIVTDYVEFLNYKIVNEEEQAFKIKTVMDNSTEFIDSWLLKFGIAEKLKFEMSHDGDFMLKSFVNNQGHYFSDHGFGMSQLLPIILSIGMSDAKFMLIEEPESHLHPKYQSLLADLFVDAVVADTRHSYFKPEGLIIETHSEYLIRKLQFLVGTKKIKKEDIAIYYFSENNPLNRDYNKSTGVNKISILDDGCLTENFGSGFFDEADNLAIDLFNLKKQQKN